MAPLPSNVTWASSYCQVNSLLRPGRNWIRRTADSLEPHRTRIVAMRAEGLTPAAIDLALDGHQTDPAPAPTPGPAAPAPWTPTVVPDALDHDAHAAAVRSVRSALA